MPLSRLYAGMSEPISRLFGRLSTIRRHAAQVVEAESLTAGPRVFPDQPLPDGGEPTRGVGLAIRPPDQELGRDLRRRGLGAVHDRPQIVYFRPSAVRSNTYSRDRLAKDFDTFGRPRRVNGP